VYKSHIWRILPRTPPSLIHKNRVEIWNLLPLIPVTYFTVEKPLIINLSLFIVLCKRIVELQRFCLAWNSFRCSCNTVYVWYVIMVCGEIVANSLWCIYLLFCSCIKWFICSSVFRCLSFIYVLYFKSDGLSSNDRVFASHAGDRWFNSLYGLLVTSLGNLFMLHCLCSTSSIIWYWL